MLRRNALLAIPALLLACKKSGPPTTWRPSDGSFEVSFPPGATPTESTSEVATDGGPIRTRTIRMVVGRVHYMLVCAALDGREANGEDAVVEAAVNGVITNTAGATLIRNSVVYPSVGAQKGRELMLEYPSGTSTSVLRERVFVVGAQLVQVGLGWTKDRGAPPDGDAFLDSFKARSK